MPTPKDDVATPPNPDNEGSPQNRDAGRQWTAKDMATARPMPLPEVDANGGQLALGEPHIGTGQVSEGGPPEGT